MLTEGIGIRLRIQRARIIRRDRHNFVRNRAEIAQHVLLQLIRQHARQQHTALIRQLLLDEVPQRPNALRVMRAVNQNAPAPLQPRGPHG